MAAERCDVEEELTRLHSHFDQFERLSAHPDPVGRRLDFLLQEMAREGNTIGAKSQDAAVAHFRHPRWWIDKVRAQHPLDWERILHAGNTHPPMGLRLNRRRIDEAEALARFAAAGIAATKRRKR